MNDIAEKLEPQHLKKSPLELKEEIEEAKKEEESNPIDEETLQRRRQRRYPFHFRYRDAEGKLYEGDFVSLIPTVAVRQDIGILRARMSGGVPFSALDPNTNELNYIVANLTYRLEGELPAWAKDITQLVDVSVLEALYQEVQAHEATFFGRERAEEAS